MKSIIVFCIGNNDDQKYQYAFLDSFEKRAEVIQRNLYAQIDIHEKLGMSPPIILTNFDFSYKGINAINMPEEKCKTNFFGNKYTYPIKYINDNKITDSIWLHDYDCFPQENFSFPYEEKDLVGGICTGPEYFNGGSLFLPENGYQTIDIMAKIYNKINYHKSDEVLLNDLMFKRDHVLNKTNNEFIREHFKASSFKPKLLSNTYNYSFAMAKHVKSLDFTPKAIHYHPESNGQTSCFAGKNIIRKEIQEILEHYFPLEYRLNNDKLYTKWRRG
jgi:hypothetical protein